MNKKSLLTAAAISGLMLSATGCATDSAKTTESQVMCYGVNSCKGQGVCAGKVDACSGKNGCEAKATCHGHNSCKGKGFIKLSKADCDAKGGKAAK